MDKTGSRSDGYNFTLKHAPIFRFRRTGGSLDCTDSGQGKTFDTEFHGEDSNDLSKDSTLVLLSGAIGNRGWGQSERREKTDLCFCYRCWDGVIPL